MAQIDTVVLTNWRSRALAFLYSGLYSIGADGQHTKAVYWALETLRDRSIERAAADIQVPDLTDPVLLLSGGPDYNEMCASCSVTYRVAVGPQKGRKVFTLQTVPPTPEPSPDNPRVAKLNGFSLHASQRRWSACVVISPGRPSRSSVCP